MVAKQVSEVHTSAKLVNEISMGIVMPEEIIYQINMIGGGYSTPHPASVPVPEVIENPITEEQFQETITRYLNSTGTSGKFFDNLRPPEFSGERKDFEVWQQRFTWYIRNKSAVFAAALKGWASLEAGMSLRSLGIMAARKTGDVASAEMAIRMGLELHGYLQAALQGCGLDRVLMPQADSKWLRGVETPS